MRVMLNRYLLLLLIVFELTPRTVLAQGPTPWLQMTIVQVEPAMIDEYLALQREISARMRRGGPAWRTVSRTEGFGDMYRFVILSPLANLASLEAAARNADPELVALNGRAQRYVKTQQTIAIRSTPELDKPLAANQQPGLMLVNIAKVIPGREQDYFNIMKSDFLPHFDKANYNHLTGLITFGAETGYVHFFYITNLAALDQGSPVVKSLGAAGAQAVTAKLSGVVTSTEQWIVRLVPDLSYGGWSPSK
jgi:hypothetical protein